MILKHRLFIALHATVLLATIVVLLISRLSEAPKTLLDRTTAESGPFEIASVVVLLLIGVSAGWTLFRSKRLPCAIPRGHVAFCALTALAATLAALEELSWGQHLFGWETPEMFERHNEQDETNLHNLLPPELFGLAVNTASYLLFLFLPLFVHGSPGHALLRKSPLSKVTQFVPSLHCMLVFCAGFALQAYFKLETATDTLALMLGLFLLGYLLHVRKLGSRNQVRLHFYIVSAFTLIVMFCHPVLGYENQQYEIRELVFMYGFLFWFVDYSRLILGGSEPPRSLFIGGVEEHPPARS